MRRIKSIFPISESLKNYTYEDGRSDLMAGITVAVMLVPQGMAYAMLAGMPPIYGLYGGLIPLFLYAILGTSRQMSVGPVAISSLLIVAGISQIAQPMTEQYISLVLLAGLMIGIAQFSLGLLRIGFVVKIISHAVIIGFTSAAAIIIAISQLKDLLGIEIPRAEHSYQTLVYAIKHIEETNLLTLVICLGSMVLIYTLKKINRAIPGALLAVIICTLLVYWGGISDINIVGTVPDGLPGFSMPELDWKNISSILPTVFVVTIIGIVESIAIAKVIQGKHKDYEINPNQEFIALGIAKIGGAFFQALPTSGSFTRSAVNNEAGARSGFASIFTALIIGLTLMFLTPLFYYLPKAVLAAIILLSIFGLFDLSGAKELWRKDRYQFLVMLVTFICTLLVGIEMGVLIGVVFSLLVQFIRRLFKPK